MAKNRKPIYVLGTGLSHDGSACLLKDGRVCLAIEKERITRHKHDGGNDTAAIQYCLDAAGISISDITLVVQNANFGMFKQGNAWWGSPRLIGEVEHVVTISHHLAHAYSAIGTSQFKESAVMVIDGCGNSLDDCIDLEDGIITEHPPAELRHLYFEKDSYYIFKDNKVTPVMKDFSQWGAVIKNYPMYPNTTLHSIGGLYLSASMYIFSGFEDPGKLMGLAPYGRPGIYDFEVFDLREGRSYVRYDWMHQFDRPCHNYDEFKQNFQYYADIAYWIQREVERAILYVFNSRFELAPSDSVAYAGGVALNAVANRRILTETKFKDVYIQPAAGDNGVAMGCAYYGWMEVLKRERVLHNGSMYLGKTYQENAINEALARHSSSLQYFAGEDQIGKTAELLAKGKIVGWFQGGAEFGPRALGHRSILADPRKPEIRDFINAHIKFREDFRPFAPSVLLEDASIYFDCDYESPFMILVAPVKPEWRNVIPSVTHEDQSARIQTVTRISSPKYYELLCAFKRITGISVLLNTSFNRRGMPIVETPEQAIRFFLDCEMDVLVLDNYLIYKTAHADEQRNFANPIENFINDIRNALEDNDIARALGGVYRINITGTRMLTIDLSREKPAITEGEGLTTPLAIIELAESDLPTFLIDPLVEGNRLFQEGKIKLEGNQNYALRLVRSLRIGLNRLRYRLNE
jgi:carbamoyltransferase